MLLRITTIRYWFFYYHNSAPWNLWAVHYIQLIISNQEKQKKVSEYPRTCNRAVRGRTCWKWNDLFTLKDPQLRHRHTTTLPYLACCVRSNSYTSKWTTKHTIVWPTCAWTISLKSYSPASINGRQVRPSVGKTVAMRIPVSRVVGIGRRELLPTRLQYEVFVSLPC